MDAGTRGRRKLGQTRSIEHALQYLRCSLLLVSSLLLACNDHLPSEMARIDTDVAALSQVAGYDLQNAPSQAASGTDVSVDFIAPARHTLSDWIGIFRVGDSNTAYQNWVRVPAGAGGKVTIATRLGFTGAHEFRYFIGSTYQLAASSPSFSVTAAGSYSVEPLNVTAAPGTLVSVRFTAPANHSQKDWIALYSAGASVTQYKAGVMVPSAASGVVTLTIPRSARGAHFFRYLVGPTYDVGATSQSFQVSGSAGVYALNHLPSNPTPGTDITVNYTAPTNHSTQDWIGLYAVGADLYDCKSWSYVPASATGTVRFTLPLAAAGSYEFRYFVGATAEIATTSASFVVSKPPGVYSVVSLSNEVSPGSAVTAQFDVPANHAQLDWIGVFAVGAANNASESSERVPLGASGTIDLLVRLNSTGPHEFRYFVGDTYELAATSPPFDVEGAPGTYAFVGVPSRSRNDYFLDVHYDVPASHSTEDWIGLYPVGGQPSDYVDWVMVPAGTTGSVSMPIPSGLVGAYELRYLVGFATDVAALSAPIEVRTPEIETDKTNYRLAEPLTVSWTGAMSNGDSVVIVHAVTQEIAAALSTNAVWSGSVVFSNLPQGQYTAQLRDSSGEAVVVGEPFTVYPPPSIARDRGRYFADMQPIQVTWSSWPFDERFVAIVSASDPTDIIASAPADVQGSYEFWNIQPGRYIVQLLNDAGFPIATSEPFDVVMGPTASIGTENPAYGDSVLVSWENPAGLEGNIEVVPTFGSDLTPVAGVSVEGRVSGSFSVGVVPAGYYEIRWVEPDGAWSTVLTGLDISPKAVAASATEFLRGTPVNVKWSNGSETSARITVGSLYPPWATFAEFNVPPFSFGTQTVEGLPIGDYIINYFESGSDLIAASAPFSVYERLWAGKTETVTHDFVVVTWRDVPGLDGDQVVIAPDGSSDDVIIDAVEANSRAGSYAFGPLPPGIYRARYFRAKDSTKLYESNGFALSTPTPATYVAVSAGAVHSCGITMDHHVQCWGNNSLGELDSSRASTDVAVDVLGLENIVAVSVGDYHSCALNQQGQVACWGDNSHGQLGNGQFIASLQPVWVYGIVDAVSVVAGSSASCAVLANGKVRCWGSNVFGLFGDQLDRGGSATLPLELIGLDDVKKVAFRTLHACVLLNDGTLRCWGYNGNGELGNGTTEDSFTPQPVVGINDATDIAVGDEHSCAALLDGSARCWGGNWYGQLGNGEPAGREVMPVQVQNLTGVLSLDSAWHHSCARLSTGTVSCWGANWYGQLGTVTPTDWQSTPVGVSDLTSVRQLSVGGYGSCALRNDGSAACWGNNDMGQLGNAARTATHERQVSGSVSLASGTYHVCALSQDGHARCWGNNDTGQLGNRRADFGGIAAPVLVETLDGITALDGGWAHTCAIANDGRVRCWGDNSYRQLGDGTQVSNVDGVGALGVSGAVTLGIGTYHSCAATSTGGVKCWGDNYCGQLSDGTEEVRSTPVAVVDLDDVIRLGAGVSHTCALKAGGAVYCWGCNGSGQLGDGTTINNSAFPVAASGIEAATDIAVGQSHGCALVIDGTVRCWGSNSCGQLGDGTTVDSHVPVEVVGVATAVAIRAGAEHTCALLNDGRVKCWGCNGEGRLGDGSRVDRALPVAMSAVHGATDIALGDYYSCALHGAQQIRCWGANFKNQLGVPNFDFSATPQVVLRR